MFSSFRNRNYRLFWIGQLLSVIGTWIQRVAQSWLVIELTDSSFALGVVSTLQFLPMTVFSLFGGILADRFPKRPILVVTQAVMALQALALGLLISSGRVEIWHVYVLATVLGLATAFDNPTRQAFVVEMVGPEDVPNAVALNSSLFNTARIVGPAVGGAIIVGLGMALPFYINAVSFLAVIGGLLLMRPSEFHSVPRPVRGPVLTRLREGISYAAQTPSIALILIIMGFLGTFGFQSNVFLPLLAKYVLGSDALGFGGLMTAMGVGSLIAALSMAYLSRPTERLLMIGAAAFTALMALLTFSTHWLPMMAILIAWGASSIVVMATANSRLQLLAPPEMRGRVMSIYIFFFSGTAPLGAFLSGLLAEQGSVRLAIGAMTAVCALGLGLAWIYHLRHQERAPLRTVARKSTEKSSASD